MKQSMTGRGKRERERRRTGGDNGMDEEDVHENSYDGMEWTDGRSAG